MTAPIPPWSPPDQELEGQLLPIKSGPGRLDTLQQLLYPAERHQIRFTATIPNGHADVCISSPQVGPGRLGGGTYNIKGAGYVRLRYADGRYVFGDCSLVRVHEYDPATRNGQLEFFLDIGLGYLRSWEIMRVISGHIPPPMPLTTEPAEALVYDFVERSLFPAQLTFNRWSESSGHTVASGIMIRIFNGFFQCQVDLIKKSTDHLGTLREVRP